MTNHDGCQDEIRNLMDSLDKARAEVDRLLEENKRLRADREHNLRLVRLTPQEFEKYESAERERDEARNSAADWERGYRTLEEQLAEFRQGRDPEFLTVVADRNKAKSERDSLREQLREAREAIDEIPWRDGYCQFCGKRMTPPGYYHAPGCVQAGDSAASFSRALASSSGEPANLLTPSAVKGNDKLGANSEAAKETEQFTAEELAAFGESDAPPPDPEPIKYEKCQKCNNLLTKEEGDNVFGRCDNCWSATVKATKDSAQFFADLEGDAGGVLAAGAHKSICKHEECGPEGVGKEGKVSFNKEKLMKMTLQEVFEAFKNN